MRKVFSITAIIMFVSMCLSVINPLSVLVASADNTTSLTSAFTITAGKVSASTLEEIDVPVSFSNVPANGICTAEMSITYDPTKLEYISLEAGSIVKNPNINFALNKVSDGELKILFLDYTVSNESITKDGDFAHLRLKVLATSGEAAINLVYTTFGDSNLAPVKGNIIQGVVNVMKAGVSATPSPTHAGVTPVCRIDVGSTEGKMAELVTVPIRLSSILKEITSSDLTITYDPTLLKYISSQPGEIVKNPENLVIKSESEGKINVHYSTSDQEREYLGQSGVFAELNFEIVGDEKNSASIEVSKATIKEGEKILIPEIIKSGKVKISGLKVEFCSIRVFPGESSVVPIAFTDTPVKGIGALEMTITYDTTKLEYVTAVPGDIVKNQTLKIDANPSEGVLKIDFPDNTMKDELIDTDGVFAKVTFKALSRTFSQPINISIDSVRDINNNNVSVENVSGEFDILDSELKKYYDDIVPRFIKISGYVAPDFVMSESNKQIVKAGFKVELEGTPFSALTDGNGYFEMLNVPVGKYSIKISKTNYLTKKTENISVYINGEVSTSLNPFFIWAGDVEINNSNDGAINMEDIMAISKAFATVKGDSDYQECLDLNMDGAINLEDIMIVAKHFNKVSSDY